MAIVMRQTTINAAPEEVFAFLSDISKHSQWAAHNLQVEAASPGAVKVGSEFNTVGHQMGTHKGHVEITELVPNEKIVYESDDDVGRFRHSITIQPDGQSVRVTKGMEALKLRFPYMLFFPIASRTAAPKLLEGDLSRIKERLEHKA